MDKRARTYKRASERHNLQIIEMVFRLFFRWCIKHCITASGVYMLDVSSEWWRKNELSRVRVNGAKCWQLSQNRFTTLHSQSTHKHTLARSLVRLLARTNLISLKIHVTTAHHIDCSLIAMCVMFATLLSVKLCLRSENANMMPMCCLRDCCRCCFVWFSK